MSDKERAPKTFEEYAHNEAVALTLYQTSSLLASLSSNNLEFLSLHTHHKTAMQLLLHNVLVFFLLPFKYHFNESNLYQEFGKAEIKPNSLRMLHQIKCTNEQ
ncbi:hypothetical protein LguiB_011612 [Lonicera macranthoides]